MNDIKKICNATNLKYLAIVLMFFGSHPSDV